MKNFKKGDLVLLKNRDKNEIYGVFEAYKISLNSDEYSYELITFDGHILDNEYVDSDFIKYNLTISNKELNDRLSFDYKKVIEDLEYCNLLFDNFKEEQRELINRIVNKYSYDCAYSLNILDIINEMAVNNNQSMIKFTSKYVPYILNTIEDLKSKNTHLSVKDIINNGLMVHLYNTMKENKSILYKRMLLNRIAWELECIQEMEIFGFINNMDGYIDDDADVFLLMNPKDVLLYMEEYLKEMINTPLNDANEIKRKIDGFYYFLKEKIK